MISQNQNSFENLGTILLDLLTRRGKTITEELRDALAFFMLHLGQAEHLGGLCAELDATPQNKKYAELLREAELLTDSSNKIADEPNNLSVAPTPFLLDESEPKKLRIYSRRNFCSESRLAAGIHGMCSTSASDVNEVKEALAQLEQTLKNARENGDKKAYSLNPLQLEAAELAVSEKFSVICGGPGTGKTTTVKAILNLYEGIYDRVALCAPTGRAAKRLTELTGHSASTIHRLLEVDYSTGSVRFIHNEKNLLPFDVIILDEMSMVDAKLFQALLAAARYHCRIIMVGDADQLPSVGPGSVLGEILQADVLPTVRLNEIFRQAQKSMIVQNAHRIVEGQMPIKGGRDDDFFMIESTGLACQRLICDLVSTRLPKSYGYDPVRDIQVLCPTKVGPTGSVELNRRLQAILNPPAPDKPQIIWEQSGRVLRCGDKVMQIKNDYDIPYERDGAEAGVGAYNGDMGIITAVDPESRAVTVQMDDRKYIYGADQLAVDAMRKMFDTVNISGTVVIGEGEMDEAPMLYIGEHVGAGGPEVDIAVDPVEGTNLVAKGQPGAIAVIAIAPKGCLLHAPDMYMDKIAVGPRAKGCIDINAPVKENLERVAKALDRKVGDLTVVLLDRERHYGLMDEIRSAGARIHLITDGDVNPIVNAGIEGTGVHMYIGRGGAPEGVLAAAAIKCLGGDMQARLCPEDEAQVKRCLDMGIGDVNKVLTLDDMVKGDDCMFTATAITECQLLNGLRYFGGGVRTHTVSMRYKTGTVRFVDAVHSFDRKDFAVKL